MTAGLLRTMAGLALTIALTGALPVAAAPAVERQFSVQDVQLLSLVSIAA